MIAVIGGGLIGACAAFELDQAGEEVVVFDADLPGAAWRAGAGLLTPSGERLKGTALEADAHLSLQLWPDFARRLEVVSGQSVGFRQGVYCVAFDEDEARALHSYGEGDEGTPSQWGFSATRFHEGEGCVHPPSVRGAALSGLRVVNARVERIEALDYGVRLHSKEESFEARAAILCCGAWSRDFGLPVHAVQGQALLLDGARDAPALYGPPQVGSSQYALGRLDGVYVGATSREADTSETLPDGAALVALREKARRLLGDEVGEAPLLQQMVGFRPMTPDGLPIIGRHPTLARVVVATGHSRHGALLAPLTARRVVQLVREVLAEQGFFAREEVLA